MCVCVCAYAIIRPVSPYLWAYIYIYIYLYTHYYNLLYTRLYTCKYIMCWNAMSHMVFGLTRSFSPRLHRPCFLHGRHFLRRRCLCGRCRRQVRMLRCLPKGWGSTCQSVDFIHWFLAKFAGNLMFKWSDPFSHRPILGWRWMERFEIEAKK